MPIRSVTLWIASFFRTAERILLGRTKSPTEVGIFRHLSLVAFLAWVGLGSDGLSSSCYGPEEAYLALQGNGHLAIFLAAATAITVAIIAASYTQIIELFPGGGGGYIVASRLLSPDIGVVSGCALVIDYILTIAVSVASGVDALLSFTSHAQSPLKLPLALGVILILVLLNLRGVKESVKALLPIFLLFIATHAILILGSFITHADALPGVFSHSMTETRSSIATMGLWTTIFLFLRAFSMGAGTYTGIEAVSNGLPVLREPRARTGKRTMLYLALSLSITAGGILVGYRLFHIEHQPGMTLNASLIHAFSDPWNSGPIPFGTLFVLLTLISEGALLFVAAQTGFLDGPRVMASMAVDHWVPNRFANLSGRLVTKNGILMMGVGGAIALIYTRGSVKHLVVMYSINVFVTFTLSQLGMVRHWWQVRREERGWLSRLVLNGAGMTICAGILIVTVSLKFFQGGWITVLVTGSFVALAYLIRRHYRRVGFALTMLNLLVEDSIGLGHKDKAKEGRTLALFVNRYDGLGLHTLGRARDLWGDRIRKVVFLSVVQVDSDQFKNEEHVAALEAQRVADLQRYEALARGLGMDAESRYVLGTDVIEELVGLARSASKVEKDLLFVAGQVVFERETLTSRLLHNEVAFVLQKRLLFDGFDFVILPVKVPEEIW